MSAPQTPKRQRPTAKNTPSYTSSPNTPFSTPGTRGSGSGYHTTPEACSGKFSDELQFNASSNLRRGENKSNTDLPVTNLPPSFESPRSNPLLQSFNTTVHRSIPDAAVPKLQVVGQVDAFDAEAGKSHQKSHQSGKGQRLQSMTAADIQSLRDRFDIKSADSEIEYEDLTISDNEKVCPKAQTTSDHRINNTTDSRGKVKQTELLLGHESKRSPNDPTSRSTGSSSNAIQDNNLGSAEMSGTLETKSSPRNNKGADSSTRLDRPQKARAPRRKRRSDQMSRPKTILNSSESVPEGLPSVTRDRRRQVMSRRKVRAASEPILPTYRDNSDVEVKDALDANSQQRTTFPQPMTPLNTTRKVFSRKNEPRSATDIINKLSESLEKNNKKKKVPSEEGYIYIYTSPLCPNLVKIGATKNFPGDRVKEWESTCKIECNRIGDHYDSIFPSFRFVEGLIQEELSNERRSFPCDYCRKKSKLGPKDHEEWYEISEEHALKVVQRWRRWMLECSPYKSDGTLTYKWKWKLRTDGVRNGDWDAWTQPFTPSDISRYVLHHAWKAFKEYVPVLRGILMHPGLFIWVAIPFVYFCWGGTVTLLSLFLGAVVFLWVYLWYE